MIKSNKLLQFNFRLRRVLHFCFCWKYCIFKLLHWTPMKCSKGWRQRFSCSAQSRVHSWIPVEKIKTYLKLSREVSSPSLEGNDGKHNVNKISSFFTDFLNVKLDLSQVDIPLYFQFHEIHQAQRIDFPLVKHEFILKYLQITPMMLILPTRCQTNAATDWRECNKIDKVVIWFEVNVISWQCTKCGTF